MNPELQNVIADLARKLGTTAEKLFPILVARERLGAAVGLLVSCIFIAVFALAIWICWENREDWQEGSFFGIFAAFIIMGFFLIIAVNSFPNYFYPEAAAIYSLMHK